MPKIADTSSSAPARIKFSPRQNFPPPAETGSAPAREFRFPLLQQQRAPSITLV